MPKYRKKPVVIEAFKFYVDPMPDWFMDKVTLNDVTLNNCDHKRYELTEASCEIETLEGTMVAYGGDYIIQGIEGEIYPCKYHIFEASYEIVTNDND
ncbi:MAG: hypothetical protein ABS938_14990 [Psychrobacillus psychrodurans]